MITSNINWEPIDSYSAKATFTYQHITVSAILHVDEQGQLVDFVSDDRFAHVKGEMKSYRFSTPIRQYKNFEGVMLGSYGEAIWHFPDGLFTYGKFDVVAVEYNKKGYQK